ncbi:hypothetical protein M9H77_31868 [Catharanthus roseus]|uniref:Uncharacterized protein n=1 Tax=Catharanthus roseus TaxID=4058 RepID=A0ACC0A289_CATRO|nr:hypothetical protein M9H77_31868 [Catharanthus roseus]
MFSTIRFQRNGVKPLFFFESLYQYSTTAAAFESQRYFLVDYLKNSLGFSKAEAHSLVNKIPHRKSCRKDPNLVFNFLEKLGLNKNQIRSIVSVDPIVLSYDVDKTLKPKILVFQELGLSGSDIVRVIMYYRTILCVGRSSIVRAIEYLRKLLGTDENVAKVVKKFTPLLNDSLINRVISVNVELLQRAGFSNEELNRFVIRHPRRLIRKPQWLEENLRRVESEFGISRESKMFYRGVEVVSACTDTKINLKLNTFRSYGWSDATIYSLIRTLPSILAKSDAKIREALSFYIEVIGYTPEYMVTRPFLFTLSLERRVKPRIEVVKILNEKKLSKKKLSFYTAVCKSEMQFVNVYILPYKDKLPDLYDSYVKSAGR